MYLFLTIFLALYGGMQLYWYRKAVTIIPATVMARSFSAIFLLLMLLAPVAIRLFEQRGYEFAARWSAIIGYSWMGFLFLSCSCFLLLDCGRLLIWTTSRFGYGEALVGYFPGAGSAFMVVTLLVSLITLYGRYEATALRTETVDLYTMKIPKAAGTITVVQISDVHLGLLVGEGQLKKILAVIRAAQPDLLVATGDLVDGQMDGSGEMARLMGEIRPRLGKFAVTGNHELYAGSRQALSFLRDAGFTLLRGEVATIPGIMAVAGVDDPVFVTKAEAAEQERKLFAQADQERFLLLLKHRPVIARESREKFDLQLSGHVHKGQIFPFGFLTRIQFPLPTGLSGIEEGGAVYVSRGTGTWGPPIRFLAPPEVTVFRLRHP
jgi:uncharacterized protein